MDHLTGLAARLWTTAQPTVAAFVASVVRNRRDREDVLQETALAVFESIQSYNTEHPFVPWAIGIARNQIGTYLRKQKRDKHVFDEQTVATLQAAFQSTHELPELEYLPDCMQKLQTKAKRLCALRYNDGLKPASIAEQIGMSANSVAKSLQRIREQLRICIESKLAQGGAEG